MSLSFPTTPTHVPTLVRKPVGYHFCVGSRAGGRTTRNTLSGPTFLNKGQILPAPQSAVCPLPSQGSGATASILERYPNGAWMLAAFSRQLRDMCGRGTNFSGGIIQALRSQFLRNPLVPVSPKTTRGRFQSLVFSPVLSSSVRHEFNMTEGRSENAEIETGNLRNAVR